jgi:iron complex transport system substrate-binding protein
MISKAWWQRIQLFLVGTLMVVLLQSCHDLTQRSQTQLSEAVPPTCRTVQHELGESCVPLHPQRVIVMDQESLEILVALGIQPIATPSSNRVANKTAILKQRIKPIDLGKEGQPSIEKMVQLRPDLIIGTYILPQDYKLFSRIAPTVSIDPIHDEWKKTLQQFGEALNRNQEAEKLLDAYHQRIKDLKSLFEQKLGDTKVSIMRFYTTLQFTQFMNHVSFPGSVIEELQHVSIPTVQRRLGGSDGTFVQVSLERVDLLDADAIFVALDPGADKNFQIYADSPLWQTLNAVKNKRVYIVDSGYWIFGNILSANAILDDVVKHLGQENSL